MSNTTLDTAANIAKMSAWVDRARKDSDAAAAAKDAAQAEFLRTWKPLQEMIDADEHDPEIVARYHAAFGEYTAARMRHEDCMRIESAALAALHEASRA